jgi:PGM1 C-terminal domain
MKASIDASDSQMTDRFEALQRKLLPLWRSIETMNQDEQTIVVVPSMSVRETVMPGTVIQAFEERFLFLLLLLRQPRARLVYVTSQTIHPNIIEYYLDLLPGVISSHARPRLFLVSAQDASSRPLSEKLLERPRLLERIRGLIPNRDRAHLVPFNTTELERTLAVRLNIPMYGADPKFFPLGTKSGCRQLFAHAGVIHPIGCEDLRTIEDVVGAVVKMRAERSGLRQVLVKLNEGVSGNGNALVDLDGMPPPGSTEEPAALANRIQEMKFESPSAVFDTYMGRLAAAGGIVEERIAGEEFRSPSVQLRVTPTGKLEVLSTHDQLLGGASGQSYLGCRFPADTAYAPLITREAVKIGERLAAEGVIGRFALDFVTVRSAGEEWRSYAIELNLRKGGTTHPFLTLQFLTDGHYDAETAVFTAPSGKRKCFVASDHVESPLYRGLTVDDLFDIVMRRGLHFNQSRQTGVVFHMMACLSERGRVGLTAVGDSHEEADRIYESALAALQEEAEASLQEGELPAL